MARMTRRKASVLLWTRRPYGPGDGAKSLLVEVARDPQFRTVVSSSRAGSTSSSTWETSAMRSSDIRRIAPRVVLYSAVKKKGGVSCQLLLYTRGHEITIQKPLAVGFRRVSSLVPNGRYDDEIFEAPRVPRPPLRTSSPVADRHCSWRSLCVHFECKWRQR